MPGAAGAAAAGLLAPAGAGGGIGTGESDCMRSQAIRLIRSCALGRPAKLILVPGTTDAGDLRYLKSASNVQGAWLEDIADE